MSACRPAEPENCGPARLTTRARDSPSTLLEPAWPEDRPSIPIVRTVVVVVVVPLRCPRTHAPALHAAPRLD